MHSATAQRGPPKTSQASVLSSASYVGAGSGLVGAAIAAGNATLKGRPVVLWSAVAGGQCCALGFTFWLSRQIIASAASQTDAPTFRESLMYSSAAGSLAGMVGGALRGRGNILPGALVFGMLGLGGQIGVSSLETVTDSSERQRPLLDRLSSSKWWPLKSISDTDYENQLQDQLGALEAEITMVDQQIHELKGRYHNAPTTSR